MDMTKSYVRDNSNHPMGYVEQSPWSGRTEQKRRAGAEED